MTPEDLLASDIAETTQVAPVVVFVDDEAAILATLRSLFRRAGYSTHAFQNAPDALAFISRVPADVIISDLRMPVMTGVEFLNQASGINPQAVRIMLSGYEDKGVVMDALSKSLAHHYVLKPWDDAALRNLVQHALEQLAQQRRDRLTDLLGTVSTLPAPPRFHARVHEVLARDGSSVTDISHEIEKSPPIVAKLLRVANSVYYGSRKSITSVHDAVFFIGTEYVAGLVAAIETFHGFTCVSRPEFAAEIEGLWNSAVSRSLVAKRIAERWQGCESPETVYVTSLLQDIGQAALLCFDPERYADFRKRCPGALNMDGIMESSFFGMPHDAIGAALLEYWNFPPSIVSGVSQHHKQTGGQALPQILQIAEILQRGDTGCQHDPAVDDLVDVWRERIMKGNDAAR
jgi:HD-like signal output (HDOD) protein/CheY-like chemotaxis protein